MPENDTNLILENNIPVLEYCTLRQALDWIIYGLLPINVSYEKLLRISKEDYGSRMFPDFMLEKIKKAKKDLMVKLIAGKLDAMVMRSTYDFHFDQYTGEESFTTNLLDDSFSRVNLEGFTFEGVDWEKSVLYNFKIIPKDFYYKKLQEKEDFIDGVSGYPTGRSKTEFDALYIEIPFAQLKSLFPFSEDSSEERSETKEAKKEPKRYEIHYENNTIYLVAGNIKHKIKNTQKGKQTEIFDYVFRNPNTDITRQILNENVPSIKLDDGDRLDNNMRNIFNNNTILLKLIFPQIKTNLLNFKPEFTDDDISSLGIDVLEI